MVDECFNWLVGIAAGFHSGIVASRVGWAEASAGCVQVRWHLTRCDTCKAGDAVTERAQVRAVDAADDLLFQRIVHGKVLLEEGDVCCVLVDNDGCVGNAVRSPTITFCCQKAGFC